ncbi:MAG: ThiF family adenylyltransferase [Acidimicrobiales bacterium]
MRSRRPPEPGGCWSAQIPTAQPVPCASLRCLQPCYTSQHILPKNATAWLDSVLIDYDRIELRNLDRTLGALDSDVVTGAHKVDVATRTTMAAATAAPFEARPVPHSVLGRQGFAAALDCDVIICCVDRPWPRFVMNVLGNAHLVPVVDGGIFARVNDRGRPAPHRLANPYRRPGTSLPLLHRRTPPERRVP